MTIKILALAIAALFVAPMAFARSYLTARVFDGPEPGPSATKIAPSCNTPIEELEADYEIEFINEQPPGPHYEVEVIPEPSDGVETRTSSGYVLRCKARVGIHLNGVTKSNESILIWTANAEGEITSFEVDHRAGLFHRHVHGKPWTVPSPQSLWVKHRHMLEAAKEASIERESAMESVWRMCGEPPLIGEARRAVANALQVPQSNFQIAVADLPAGQNGSVVDCVYTVSAGLQSVQFRVMFTGARVIAQEQ